MLLRRNWNMTRLFLPEVGDETKHWAHLPGKLIHISDKIFISQIPTFFNKNFCLFSCLNSLYCAVIACKMASIPANAPAGEGSPSLPPFVTFGSTSGDDDREADVQRDFKKRSWFQLCFESCFSAIEATVGDRSRGASDCGGAGSCG